MLQIRPEQLAVLDAAVAGRLERQIIAQLRTFFPFDCATLGAEGVNDVVRLGIERARTWGFSTEADITKYINLMFTFGRDFDIDRRYPSLNAILQQRIAPDEKMRRLFAEGIARADEGQGIGAGAKR
jgi:hypothetical protein